MSHALLGASMNDSLEPHPHLASYYETPSSKSAFLRNIFDQTAADYDRLERVLGFGSGAWYRRESLRRAGLVSGMSVIDVATGTGLVAREALAIVGPAGRVIGIDPSRGMMSQIAGKLRRGQRFTGILGRGESIPLADASADFLCMGYALRHLSDLRIAFAEFHRVLRPGGKLCLLEISRPASATSRRLLDVYFRLCLPIISRLISTSAQTHRLWEYYWETIDQCVPGERVIEALSDVGFRTAQRKVSLGIFSEYIAKNP